MVSLTTASITARKGIRYSIYGLVLLIVARFAIINGTDIIKDFLPKKEPVPTVKFGALPELPFPDNYDEEIDKITYRLETPTNTLPDIPKLLNVYFMPGPQSNIRALDKAKELSSTLGFGANGRELVETVYSFTSGDSTLNMNIVSRSFSISSTIGSNPKILNSISPSKDSTVNSIKDKLKSARLLKDLTGPVNHEFLRVESGELVTAASQSLGNVTKINFTRKPYGEDEVPSVTTDPNQSNAWFVIGPATNKLNIILGEYKYYPIDEDTFSTYPLKSSQQAWDEVIQGNAYVANLGQNEGSSEIAIRNIYLAYFDAGRYVEFYQPVIVFEGDEGFTAYVPAITSEYYGQDN